MDFNNYALLYKTDLLEDIIPFWLKNSKDRQIGGYYTCLDSTGKVFDTDKFTWLQCRQIWTFSMLYNQVEKRQEWIDFAIHGADFMEKNGRDEAGNWYFSLTREGKALAQPYSIFSDCFAAMGFGQLFLATGDPKHAHIAKETFINILNRQGNPEGKYSKTYPGTRPLKGFALPMILSNLVLEIEHLLEPELVEQTIEDAVDQVMNKFYCPEFKVILENIDLEDRFSDSFEGRLVNPGHGLEAMWFMMDIAVKKGDQVLVQKAVDIALGLMEYGWDEKYGGIFYFMDVKGHPPQQLEWDMKLWWVHLEALVAMAKGYLYTRNEKCWQWFEKLHSYSFAHFADKVQGEWYGYLNRQGEVKLDLKGGKWKGCFHVPRAFYQVWKTLEMVDR